MSVAVVLLLSGAILVALGQSYLVLAYEPGREAPALGVSGLIAGFILFALGVFGRRAGGRGAGVPDTVNMSLLRSAAVRLTEFRQAEIGFGLGTMGLLVFRLWAGSESGWDLVLLMLTFCAFAVPFVGRLNVPPAGSVLPRERCIDVLIVLSLVGIFIGLNVQDLTDWYYSAIGDEYRFFKVASGLAEDAVWRPFELSGVYGAFNPVMSSIYPALVMRLVGVDNFGWKFSLVLSVAATIPAMYILGHILVGRAAAIVSSMILAFSHYVFALTHTGYPNVDVLPIIAWSIALFVLGIKRSSPC